MSAAVEYHLIPPEPGPAFCPNCARELADEGGEEVVDEDGAIHWRCEHCGELYNAPLTLDEVRRDAAADRADDWYSEQ